MSRALECAKLGLMRPLRTWWLTGETLIDTAVTVVPGSDARLVIDGVGPFTKHTVVVETTRGSVVKCGLLKTRIVVA